MQQFLRWLPCLALALSVFGCGGGGDDAGTAAPATIASRVEAGPAAVLLTSLGDSRALSAQLLDAAGAPVPGAISWSSSDPTAVAVDPSGNVRALVGAGNAWITASSGSLPPATVLVTIAQPVAGAQLLADSQIVAGPMSVDANAEPAAGNPYEVVLRGAPALSIGSILIASEAANVAGRVVSVQPEGSDQRVRLVVVPPAQLFTAFDFKDTVDLTQAPIETPPALAAAYDIVRTGNTFVFTPKPAVSSAPMRERASAVTGTRALPPFDGCEVSPEDLPLPLALSAAPAFEFTIDGTAERRANAQGIRFIVAGKPKFKLNSVLTVSTAFEAKITCKVTLHVVKFRAPGWAGALFGGDVEYGVGIEVGGKLTLANAKLGGTATLNTDLLATLDCPTGADCALTGHSSATTELTPVLQAPALEQAQLEQSVRLFGFVSLEVGNPDLDELQFKAIELKAGVELAGSVAPEALQIANRDADSGRSKYALAFKGEVGPGIKLGEFLEYAGLSEFVPLKLGFSVDLGSSPSAVSVVANRQSYLPGERASVAVKLAPASTLFPSGLFYNVHRVLLLRKTGAFSTEVLASQLAADAQTDFTLAFDAASLVDAGEIFAFVETKALPTEVPTFELTAAQAAPIADAAVVFESRSSTLGAVAQTEDAPEIENERTFAELGRFSPGPLSVDLGRARAQADQVSSIVVGADGSVTFQMRGSAQFRAEGQEDARRATEGAAHSEFRTHFRIDKPMGFTLIGSMNLQATGPETGGLVQVELGSGGSGFRFVRECQEGTPSPCAGLDVTVPLAASGILPPGGYQLVGMGMGFGRPNFSVEQASATVDFTLTLTP